MNLPRFTVLIVHSLAGIILFASPTGSAFAQGASSANILDQLSAFLSCGPAVQRVQLSSVATWYAEGLENTGTVTFGRVLRWFFADAICSAIYQSKT
jgi:hypothetical protein